MRKEENEEPEKDNGEAFQALSVFANKFDAALPHEVTDYFSSREIQFIIEQHTGLTIPLTELHELMVQMRYRYELEDGEFKWLCHGVE